MKGYVRPFYGGENKSWEYIIHLLLNHFANFMQTWHEKITLGFWELKFGHMKYFSLSEGEKMAKQTKNFGYYW